MRVGLLLGAVLLGAVLGRAADDLNCDPGTTRRIVVSPHKGRIVAKGRLAPRAAIDPTMGLRVRVVVDPETDPADGLLDVTVPPGAFAATRRGWRYRDPTGALGGLQRMTIVRRRDGTLKVALSRRGGTLALAGSATGARLVVETSDACVRTCPGRCGETRRGSLRCKASTDTALCGLRSGCEPFGAFEGTGSRSCLLPYPSNFFTRADATTATGRRIDYHEGTMPRNQAGVPVDPTPYRTLDGFSPGPIAMVHVPGGVDLAASGVAGPQGLAASLAPDSPTLIVEADTRGCVRVEHFGENDVSAADADGTPVAPPDQLFLLRPGERLQNGTRYIVALRSLVDQQGQPIPPPPAFRAIRDGTPSGSAVVEARRRRTALLLDKLQTDCGVDPATLILAWDFTTASDDAIERYLLHMRDETFAQLPGDAVPAFTVESADPDPAHPLEVCRLVKGTFTVPLWTTFDGPGAVLNLDPATDLPVQNGVATDVPFTAMIPCSLLDPSPVAGRAILYGHGLLGTGEGDLTAEPDDLRRLANDHAFVIAATDWQGFSAADLGTIAGFLPDLSGFPQLAERLHQGVLNQLVLARLLRSPSGFASDPAFRVGNMPLLDTSGVYYYGNSEGGIEGGVVMALSQDVIRGVLGVAAANYSTLLQRSRAFEPFLALLRDAYPDPVDRGLLVGLVQQLWDRSEPNGWYHHTIAGLGPGTPPHLVLVLMARGDAEVANLGTEIMVRSMGVPQLEPVNQPVEGVPQVTGPFAGSAFVESEFGVPPPPTTNTPPAANDVHEAMRALTPIQDMIDQFLRPGGLVENLCTNGPTAACDPD
jgi:hypothetical protein